MHSPRSAPARAAAGLVLALAILPAGTARAQDTASGPAPVPTTADIERALAAVKADPNLATQRTIRTLRWRTQERSASSGWFEWLRTLVEWIGGFFRFIAQSVRVLLWGLAAVLAVILAVYIARLVRDRTGAARQDTFAAPTHVRDMDIRPESLPSDVGAAARALWERGEARAALALLYRGLLSRLAHVHRLPIRDSTTEGDCLALAAELSPDRRDYVGELVDVWRRSVYGGQRADTATVLAMCDRFRAMLDRGADTPAPSVAEASA